MKEDEIKCSVFKSFEELKKAEHQPLEINKQEEWLTFLKEVYLQNKKLHESQIDTPNKDHQQT